MLNEVSGLSCWRITRSTRGIRGRFAQHKSIDKLVLHLTDLLCRFTIAPVSIPLSCHMEKQEAHRRRGLRHQVGFEFALQARAIPRMRALRFPTRLNQLSCDVCAHNSPLRKFYLERPRRTLIDELLQNLFHVIQRGCGCHVLSAIGVLQTCGNVVKAFFARKGENF